MNRWLPDLLQVFEGEKYVIWFDAHSHKPSSPHVRIVLKNGHTTRDHVKAWVHATEFATSQVGVRVGTNPDVQSLLEGVRASRSNVAALFPKFLEYIQKAGWDLDAAAGGFVTGLPTSIDTASESGGGEDKKSA